MHINSAMKKIVAFVSALSLCMCNINVSNMIKLDGISSEVIASANTLTINDFPEEYKYAADWIWTNRIEKEQSTARRNTVFDQIVAGEGTLNYVVRWQSYKQVTYEQRKQFEQLLSDCVNDWTKWLVGYENWPYDHVEVKIVGWAVIDKSCLLDLHDDEIVYTDTEYYDSQYDTSNGVETIPDKLPLAPTELSRFDHFTDTSYQYPGGLDKRFDMYMWATQGFPSIGGCGGDWGQRLSDDAYLNMINSGAGQHVLSHEIGHGFGMTDFYGGEGESDGFPPGGFPGGENSLMMAGSAAKITDFDGWMLRYMWSKIKDESGRFKLPETPSEPDTPVYTDVKGDVNADGVFNVADLLTMNKYFLGIGTLANQQAGDLINDNTINVLDVIMMKKMLLSSASEPSVDNSAFISSSLSKHGASLPSQNDAKMVVFYVDFPDCRYSYEPSVDELNQITFGSENENNVCYPFESVSSFYSRASKGSMNFTGQVFRYTTRENQSVYDDDKVKIAEECYEAFKDTVDFSQFDGNGDGKIDATLFTVPTAAGDDHWWPCAGAFGDPDYSVDGKNIGHIITGNAQVNSTSDYSNYISSYCHELGHCTGLPDYYLYSGFDIEGMHGSAGFELMDADAASDFSCFSKLVEGWYRKSQVQVYDSSKDSQTFTLTNSETDSGNCLIIPNGNLDDDYFSEYFIVEYAGAGGNNKLYCSNGGVRVYHIDATTEYGWNTYFRYASGSEFTDNDNGRRLIRIIDDTNTDNFYRTGDVIDGNISGFHWYDSNNQQTVETGLKITIVSFDNDTYTVTVSTK